MNRRGRLVIHSLLILLLVVCFGYANADVVFQDDFEQSPGGSPLWDPHPWEEYQGLFGVLTDEQAAAGRYSVKLIHKEAEANGTSHHEGGYLFTQFAPVEGELRVDTSVFLPQSKRALVIELGQLQTDPTLPGYNRGGVGAGAVSLYFHDKTAKGYSKTWEDTGFAYPLGQWIELSLLIDIPAKNYVVEVRALGEEWQQIGVIPFRRDVDRINYLHIVNYEPVIPRDTVAYIDNVRVTIP